MYPNDSASPQKARQSLARSLNNERPHQALNERPPAVVYCHQPV